jgi:hypothetical protein
MMYVLDMTAYKKNTSSVLDELRSGEGQHA